MHPLATSRWTLASRAGVCEVRKLCAPQETHPAGQVLKSLVVHFRTERVRPERMSDLIEVCDIFVRLSWNQKDVVPLLI